MVKEDHERDRWLKRMEEGEGTVLASLRLLGDGMEKLEGMVKGVGRGVCKKKVGKKAMERGERKLGELKRTEEDEEGSSDKEVGEKVKGNLSVFAKPFVFEPKGKKVDFGVGPQSPRGDTMFGWG